MRHAIHEPPRADGSWFSGLTSWLGPWGHRILTMALPFVWVILLLLCLAPCLMNFIGSLVHRIMLTQMLQYQLLQIDTTDNDYNPYYDQPDLNPIPDWMQEVDVDTFKHEYSAKEKKQWRFPVFCRQILHNAQSTQSAYAHKKTAFKLISVVTVTLLCL
ncbi:hypothetical protein SRHO_G00251400 [Serrasalmus rhombeus]